LLAARDAHLAADEAIADAALAAAATAVLPPPLAVTAAPAEHPECIICLEPYSAAGGILPRMLVTCGHSFCEGCLDTMLRPLPTRKGRKRLL
jgi:hypothetical protein